MYETLEEPKYDRRRIVATVADIDKYGTYKNIWSEPQRCITCKQTHSTIMYGFECYNCYRRAVEIDAESHLAQIRMAHSMTDLEKKQFHQPKPAPEPEPVDPIDNLLVCLYEYNTWLKDNPNLTGGTAYARLKKAYADCPTPGLEFDNWLGISGLSTAFSARPVVKKKRSMPSIPKPHVSLPSIDAVLTFLIITLVFAIVGTAVAVPILFH